MSIPQQSQLLSPSDAALQACGIQLCLASASPRRRELLMQLGYQFEVKVSQVEEIRQHHEPASDYVKRLSKQKAQAVFRAEQADNFVVLGSDTVVALGDEVFEKPADLEHSHEMLRKLSGQTHQVLTAVSLVAADYIETVLVENQVTFKQLSDDEIKAYWQTGEPCDKAGSYAIQGIGGRFVTQMQGSFHAVMGLPLYQTEELIQNYLNSQQVTDKALAKKPQNLTQSQDHSNSLDSKFNKAKS